MKTKNSQEKRKIRLRFLENLHGAMGCYLYFTGLIIALVIAVGLGLFVAERVFPKYVHIFNYSLSSRTFVELKAAHRYKAAADFYEQKKEVFTLHGNKYINMIEVFDCYKRIGEYEKAEAILTDVLNLHYLTEKEKKDLEKEPWMKDFFRFNIAKEFFNLYEEIGDVERQKQYYSIMKASLTDDVRNNFSKLVTQPRWRGALKRALTRGKEKAEKNDKLIDELIRLYDLKMLFLSSPGDAIHEMTEYINQIINDPFYKPTYIQKCLNYLIEWYFAHGADYYAYTLITNAVDYAWDTDAENGDKSEYGRLSDICYRIHDIRNSKRFYRTYSTYLADNSSNDDPEFIKNQIRGFKFLETDHKWSELENLVSECCTGLRELFGKNLQTMSESQREHFVALLDEPFDYAANLLYNHPTESLAELCLENDMFMKGLLLRSSREVANSIKASGDEIMLALYDTLLVRRKELSYREGLGKVGNTIRMNNLRKEIEELDKQLAVSCDAYRIDQETGTANRKTIGKRIKAGSAVVDFIQTDSDNLFALVMTSDGKVRSVNLGTKSKMMDLFPSDIRMAYTNPELTDMIWAPIESHLPGVTDVFYASNGIFNSVSFQALGQGHRKHLIDRYRFHLLSNVSNILSMHSGDSPAFNHSYIAMWGDVDYGGKQKSEDNDESVYHDIKRGETLRHLTFSKDEVYAIQSIVEGNNGTAIVFTDTLATETSFRSRSGKRDNILHISTHGFFSEDDAHRKDYNPMYNSGLFFAGADSTWNRVDTVFVSSAMLDDGILRADEIQYLDFSGCDLAVLSACKTGLGQSKNTEGVYGLQRAFKLAGVDKILMSLWSVNDKCTSELMQEFYLNYYSGKTDEEALRQAQSAIRERYPSPEDWGAFVLLY